MQTKASLRGIKERIILHRLLGISCASLAVFVLAFILVPTLISEASAAELSFGVTWTPMSLTLDPDVAATQGGGSISDAGHGDVLFGTIVPTNKGADVSSAATGNVGTLKILKKTIGIESTGRYYTVYISTNDNASNALAYDGDSAFTIPSVGAAFTSNPTVFSNYAWGFSVPGVENTGIDSAPTYANASVYSSRLNEELTFQNAEGVYKNVTWSAVPTKTTPQQIWKATTNNVHGFGGEDGDNVKNKFDVYYGVMVNSDVLAGTYEGQVVYTALASSNAIDSEISNNILTSTNFGADNGTTPYSMSMAFDLAESASTNLITADSIDVFVVKHNEMVAADYDVTQLGTQSNKCTVTSFSITSVRAELTCNMPITGEIADDGSADPDSVDPDEVAKANAGRYDFWIKVKPYDYNYVTKISDGSVNGTKEAFAFVGLQSAYKQFVGVGETGADEDGYVKKNYVTEMQQMRTAICNNTNRWGIGMEADARLYDYRGEMRVDGVATATPLVTEASVGSTIPEDSAVLGLGTFKLIDNRDGEPYLVRRFDDGNCWMVSNLTLDLASFVGTDGLNSTNTNISASRSDLPVNEDGVRYWDPRKSMLDYARTLDEGVTVENYFETASLDKIGVKLHYQFQPSGIYGGVTEGSGTVTYIWGSYYYDDADTGEIKKRDSLIHNNTYSQMPRSYNHEYLKYVGGSEADTVWQESHASTYYGNKYNWYAATAESGTYAMSSSDVSSSICPYGWRLPSGRSRTSNKSWAHLIFPSSDEVAHSTWQAQLQALKAIPFSLAETGEYRYSLLYSDEHHWATSSVNGAVNNRTLRVGMSTWVSPSCNTGKIHGTAIRCVSN